MSSEHTLLFAIQAFKAQTIYCADKVEMVKNLHICEGSSNGCDGLLQHDALQFRSGVASPPNSVMNKSGLSF